MIVTPIIEGRRIDRHHGGVTGDSMLTISVGGAAISLEGSVG